MTEPDAPEPAEAEDRSGVSALIRIVGLVVIGLVVPMLLIGAMTPAQGCGGG